MTVKTRNLLPIATAPFLVVACARPSHAPPVPRTRAQPSLVETSRCVVKLTKLSYDDPGADDAEFLELNVRIRTPPQVDGVGGAAPQGGDTGGHPDSSPASLDAGPAPLPACGTPEDAGAGVQRPDGSSEAGARGVRTLGACGLLSLELLNGGGDECSVYRTIDLASVPIPESGFVTFCSEESQHGTACSVTHAGEARLGNGWIQNGPSDGLRFLGSDGRPLAEFSYEGVNPSCYTGDPHLLVEEKGALAGANGELEDDVNVLCAESFALRPASQARLGTLPECPAGRDGSAPAQPEAKRAASDPADAGAALGRRLDSGRAPPAAEAREPSPEAPPAVPADPIVVPDAGLPRFDAAPPSRSVAVPRQPPGCTITIGRTAGGAGCAALVLILAGLLTRRSKMGKRRSA